MRRDFEKRGGSLIAETARLLGRSKQFQSGRGIAAITQSGRGRFRTATSSSRWPRAYRPGLSVRDGICAHLSWPKLNGRSLRMSAQGHPHAILDSLRQIPHQPRIEGD
jgi:hypothetical protein